MKSIDHGFDISKEFGLTDLPNEIWKDISNYERVYQVSNFGRIKSLERKVNSRHKQRTVKEKILRVKYNKFGYKTVCLSSELQKREFFIHRLVAYAFIPNPENKPQIDHINGIKSDNRVENLRWVTAKENSNNPVTLQKLKGSNNYWYNKKGKNAFFYGKHHSDKTKEKLKELNTGSNHPLYGKKLSVEIRLHMSASSNRKRKVINLNTGDIFQSAISASRFYGLNRSSVTKAIIKRCKSAGYYWGYYTE